MSNWYTTQHVTMQDVGSMHVAISEFVQKSQGDAITVRHTLTLNCSLLSLARKVKELLKKQGIETHLKSDQYDFIFCAGDNVMAAVFDTETNYGGPAGRGRIGSGNNSNLFTVTLRTLRLEIAGSIEILEQLTEDLALAYEDQRFAQIKWWYKASHGAESHTVFIEAPKTSLRREFYPGLGDPNEYIKKYLDSEASVLLVAGPPGTAKTTLLRHMIYDNSLSASVVYDESLMESDQVFQAFLFNQQEDLLIIEDADVILASREADSNKLMSRFLNVSDGLIKLPNKKLVFTTNLTDFGKVDAALMRPGRCFDVLKTRELDYGEAVAAAKAAGLPLPTDERKQYTIAELFNQGKAQEPRRIGFAVAK